jgi:hypothetical protein
MSRYLFDKGEPSPARAANEAEKRGAGSPHARLRVPQRNQVEMRQASLDQLIESNHHVPG